MGVKSNFLLIFKYLKLNMQKEMKYKTAFVSQILGMIINDLFLIIQIMVIYSVTDNLAGLSYNSMLLMMSISAGSFGVSHMLFGGIFHLTNKIYNGMIDVYLTQPKNALLNIACSATDVGAIGDIVFSFVLLLIINAPWWMYFAIIPIIICGALIMTGIYATYATLSFYVKNGDAVADATLTALTITDRYPAGIYNLVTRVILFTVIPALFYTFVPVQYILTSFNLYWFLGYIGVAIFWSVIPFVAFKFGLKRYTSGSLMGGRL